MREILNGVSRHVETDLRDAVFAHLLTLDAAAAGRWRTGELMARLTGSYRRGNERTARRHPRTAFRGRGRGRLRRDVRLAVGRSGTR